MPSYTIDIPGQGSFTVDSPNELSPEQAYAMALRGGVAPQQAAQQSIPQQQQNPMAGPDFGQAGVPAFVDPTNQPTPDRGSYGQRVGRRIYEAGQSAMDIPQNLMDVVTGGQEGGVLPRVVSALKVAQGVFSPASIVLSPVEAAAEYVAKEMSQSEGIGDVAGAVAGIGASFGLGALASAGKLGSGGSYAARLLGMARPKDVNEVLKHDPQLRYIATRNVETELMAKARAGDPDALARLNSVGVAKEVMPTHPLDDLAAQSRYWNPNQPNLAQEAADAGTPNLARAALYKQDINNDIWGKFAVDNKIVGEIPASPEIDWKKLALMQIPRGGDAGLFSSLGTPATQAARNPAAFAAHSELMLAESKMNDLVINYSKQHISNLQTAGDRSLRQAVLLNHTKDLGEISNLHATGKIADDVYRASRYIADHVEQYRVQGLAGLRSSVETSTYSRLLKEAKAGGKELGKDLAKTELDAATRAAILKRYPDNMSIDDILAEVSPGYYKVFDKAGNPIGNISRSKGEARDIIYDHLKNGGEIGSVDSRAFFPSEFLSFLGGRAERTMKGLANAMKFGDDELMALRRGEFSVKKGYSIFGGLVESVGAKGRGYAKDVVQSLSMFDRQMGRFLGEMEYKKPVNSLLKELDESGYSNFAHRVRSAMTDLKGFRPPLSVSFDNTVKSIPLLRDIAPPYLLEKIAGGTKSFMVNAMLKYNPRYQALNASQLWQTLWPIADYHEITDGLKLWKSGAGEAIIKSHGLTTQMGKVEDFTKSLGPIERFNQNVAFLTMYNRARKLGFGDIDAADYARLRGNFYSQFLGATTDTPYFFRKLDPLGMITMFQRFPIKQYEQVFDALKDGNFPTAGKWLFTNLALGGMKAATLGEGGWLTYKMYDDIKKEYGEGMADLIHTGLPSLVGADLSNSVMLFNPPMGQNFKEKLGSVLMGPVGNVAFSAWGAAVAQGAPNPDAASRVFKTLVERFPLFKEADAARRLVQGDYELTDPLGRMKYKADAKDLVRRMMGVKTMKESNVDAFANALIDVTDKRNAVLDHIGSRYGQAMVSGIDLGPDMTKMLLDEVNGWNTMMPEFFIDGKEILGRAAARAKTAQADTVARMLQHAPAKFKQSQMFGPQAIDQWLYPEGRGR